MVGQRPPQRRGHPVGMIGTKRVSLTRADGGYEIVQPYGSVVVAEGHNGGTGAAATCTVLNHGLNLERVEGQTKDLWPRMSPARPKALRIRRKPTAPSRTATTAPRWSMATTDGTRSMPADWKSSAPP